MDLATLNNLLTEMAKQAAQTDRSRKEGWEPLFDEQLFYCRSSLLTPYVAEAKHNLETLETEQRENRLSAARASHLCERLLNQVTALKREQSTGRLRTKFRNTTYRKPSVTARQLYENLAQHREWERRLENMVREEELRHANCASWDEQQACQQKILATESRLQRCRDAITNIEKQIAKKERYG
ncbi:primosomal replication protein [Parasalinivibrio latis]|uniref:primosomal replication protein PriC n=1 Tax=Parasalinivibrio latis TaxID=2952610 RepID=UPI0030E5BE27